MFRARFLFILLAFALSAISCNRDKIIEDEDGVIKTTLENGLTVIIKENHAAPVVTILTNVKVGYLDEPDAQSGISHLLEHMYFKGTEKRPKPADIWKASRMNGGSLNAWTHYDQTVYHITLPSRNFKQGLELEVDALMNPKFDPTELSKETEVVIQEGKRKKDNPRAFVDEMLKGIAFEKHRLRRWRMGSEDGLRNLTRKNIIDYFKTYYKANNMIVVVVGDIHARETLKAIKQQYKNFKKSEIPNNKSEPEPKQTKMRYKRKWADIKNSYVGIGYKTPPARHPDVYVLDLISYLLSSGRSSRLHKTLKLDKELVNAIGTNLEYYEDAGFFTINARLNAKAIYSTEIAIFTELERLKYQAVSEKELQKIKHQLEITYYRDHETTSSVAHELSSYERYGDYRDMKKYFRTLMAITPQDIQRVARTYFDVDKSSIFEYISRKERPHTYPSRLLASKLKGNVNYFKKNLKKTLPILRPITDEKEDFLSKAIKDKKRQRDLPLKRYKLSNDATVLLKESHSLPLVSLTVFFKGGRVQETRKNSGLTQLMLRTSIYSTTTRSEKEIHESLEQMGTKLETTSRPDYFGYTLTAHQKDLDRALTIMSDIILNPSFSRKILNRERQNILSDINRLEDHPSSYTDQLFRQAALKNHPYGLPRLGIKWSILNITPDQLVTWHSKTINSTDMIISAVGDFNTLEIRTSLENYFKRLRPRTIERPPIDDIKLPSFISENFKRRQKEQTAMTIGFKAVSETDKDYPTLKLIQMITNGIAGRFGQRLRTEEKLAYVVYSRVNALDKGGLFTTYTAVSPENEKRALRALLEEYKKLTTDLADKKELTMAKNFIRGLYTIRLQSFETQAHEYARNEIYGKPTTAIDDYLKSIEDITPEQVHEVASKYFNLSKYTLGIVRGIQKEQSIISNSPKPIAIPRPKPKPKPKPNVDQ